MVKAVVDVAPSGQIDLVSLPGGWVQLRKLSYGEMLERQDMAMKMAVEADQKSKSVEATVEAAQGLVTNYEFARAVVDHNLEDENGNKLNFRNPADIQRLDPQVGGEISELIDNMNQPPDLGKSQESSSSLSSPTPATTS